MENNSNNTTEFNPNTSVKKYLPIAAIVFALLIVIGLAVTKNKTNPGDLSPTLSPATETSQEVTNESDSSTEEIQEFNVKGSNFKFDIAEIKVKKGDKVKITFTNTEGTHDFVLDDFNVKTNILKENASETVEFIADKSGDFEYYCSVGSHRAMGMKGTLTVE